MINSTFSFQLVSVLINGMVMEIFTAYSLLWEIRFPSVLMYYVLLQHSLWLFMQVFMQVMLAYAGSALSVNAKETGKIVAKILNEHDLNENLTKLMQNFISRTQCNDFNVQNIFFAIDWRMFVAVRK